MVKVAASGYFNPLHRGHIEYLEYARALGDQLVVIVNSDWQRGLKGARAFMDERERMYIVGSLRCVDAVFLAIDEDGSVCRSLEVVRPDIFAKGGDRFAGEVPEWGVCARLGIRVVDGLGEKVQSSSWLLGGVGS